MARPPSPQEPTTRFAVYAAASALVGTVPVPMIPRRVLRAVRGALAHDVCARRGLSLTREAREVLAEPWSAGQPPRLGRDAVAWVAGRVLSRLVPRAGLLAPVRNGFDTMAFGRLFERYLEVYRPSSPTGRVVRIDGDEATIVRKLLDRAALRALDPRVDGRTELTVTAPEEHRTTAQRTVDFALIGASRLPEALGRRLDTALDEIMEERAQQGGSG